LHHLIFSGTLERHPDLKILAVHGGGYLPAYSGRIDHAWGARKDSHGGLPKPPTHYLRKIWFDNEWHKFHWPLTRHKEHPVLFSTTLLLFQ
jgi:aminocarboxymuconate-semialdehyde decarboxylase